MPAMVQAAGLLWLAVACCGCCSQEGVLTIDDTALEADARLADYLEQAGRAEKESNMGIGHKPQRIRLFNSGGARCEIQTSPNM